jgi:hypothetical protein
MGRGDRDVARVRGAHTSKTMYAPPAMPVGANRHTGVYDQLHPDLTSLVDGTLIHPKLAFPRGS